MERSEETLTTRDLAQPNEPADGGAVDSAGEGSVYDQERVGREESGEGIPAAEQTGIGSAAGEQTGIGAAAGEQTGIGAEQAERPGAVPPAGGDDPLAAGHHVGGAGADDRAMGTAAGGGGTAVGGAQAPVGGGGTAVGGAEVAGAVAPGTTGAGAAGTATADAGPARAGATGDGATGDAAPLLSAEASTSFQQRWEEVQTRFVDEPRGAVEEADGLVANLMQQLAEGFAQERERLEAQWGRGEDISTEDLRVALQRYRSFFHRLLSA